MSDEIIEKACRYIVNKMLNEKIDKSIGIGISGGECLLYPRKLKYLISHLRKKALENNVSNLAIEVSTNLSLLTDDLILFFSDTNCNLFIGFDGIMAAQDLNRIYFNSEISTYNECFSKIKHLYDSNSIKHKKITINTVITSNNVHHLNDSFDFLHCHFPDFVLSYNVAYNTDWNEEKLLLLSKELNELSIKYIKELKKDPMFSINIFDRQMNLILHEDENMIPRCGACDSSIGITPEGNLVGCSTLTGTLVENKCVIGNLDIGINKLQKKTFIDQLIELSRYKECLDCNYYKRCYYYCPSTNYLGSGDMFIVSKKHCEINKMIINISEKLIFEMNKLIPDTFAVKFL